MFGKWSLWASLGMASETSAILVDKGPLAEAG